MTEQEGTTAEEVLLYLIAQLVEHPDQVELEIEETAQRGCQCRSHNN